ncbi:fimbrial protein [Pseudocitrobacter corydidari]
MRTLFSFVSLMLLFTSSSVMALECHKDSISGSTSERVNIGSVKIPNDVPDGTIVWRSEVMTSDFHCWSTTSKTDEYVYIYTFPVVSSSAVMPDGIKFGIIYDGQGLGTDSDKTQTSLYFEKKDKGSSKSKVLTMSYQVYIQKTGNLSSSILFDTDEVAVFQLDGVGGINNNDGVNYRYTLTGLTNLVALECSAHIPEVTDVDFGELRPWNSTGSVVARQDFSLAVSRSCDAPFSLDALFAPTGTVVDHDSVDLGNGALLKIYDPDIGEYLMFNSLTEFVDLTTVKSKTKSYQAVLVSNGESVPGEFESDIIFTVNYK